MVNQTEIEGTTPLDDYSGLKLSWVQDKKTLDIAEAENIRSALRSYLGRRKFQFPDWFTVSNMNKVHFAMFNAVWNWAGTYRQTFKSIGIEPFRIPLEMAQLQNDIAYWGDEKPFSPIEIAARVHHRLVWIHPYEFKKNAKTLSHKEIKDH